MNPVTVEALEAATFASWPAAVTERCFTGGVAPPGVAPPGVAQSGVAQSGVAQSGVAKGSGTPRGPDEGQGGLALRFTGGESRRANSATFLGPVAESNDAILDRVERFYRDRGSPPRVQMGPLAPVGLEDALAAHGYRVVAPCFVLTATPADVQAHLGAAAPGESASVLQARREPSPRGPWAHVQVTRGRFAPIAEAFLTAMESLAPDAAFLTVYNEGVPAAAALFVAHGAIVVGAAMRTLPEHRRRGAARALLVEGARFAAERGAATLCLQVETDNAAALALYTSAGFTPRYAYHYREAP